MCKNCQEQSNATFMPKKKMIFCVFFVAVVVLIVAYLGHVPKLFKVILQRYDFCMLFCQIPNLSGHPKATVIFSTSP